MTNSKLYNKIKDLETHLDNISKDEFEELVDLVFAEGQNEDPTRGMKYRDEAVAWANGLITELKRSKHEN